MNLIEKSWIQAIPAPIDKVWSFFSTPENLNRITPPEVKFKIRSSELSPMYSGQIIWYSVTPFLYFELNWLTEISHSNPPYYFVDEQRVGPYRFWHHQHHFTANGNETIMKDILHYSLPLGMVGRLINRWIVESKIESIFAYRKEAIKKIFNQ